MDKKFDLKKGNVIMLKESIVIHQGWTRPDGTEAAGYGGDARLFVFLGIVNNKPKFTTYRNSNIYPDVSLLHPVTDETMTLDEITEFTERVWDTKTEFRKNFNIKLGMYRRGKFVIQLIQEYGQYVRLLQMSSFAPGIITSQIWNKYDWVDYIEKQHISIPQAKRFTQLIEERTIRQNGIVPQAIAD